MLEQNIKTISESSEPLAEDLRSVCVDSLEWCVTRQNEPNLCDTSSGLKTPVHAAYSAAKEADRWFEALDLQDTQVLYVYGIGLGYAFDRLKPWLEEKAERYLIFIEDDVRILRRLLETSRGGEILDHKQVRLARMTDDLAACHTVCDEQAFYYVGLRVRIGVLPHYERTRLDAYDALRTQIMHSTAYALFAGEEFLSYGATFYRNFYSNLLRMEGSFGCNSLYGGFEGVPAIICGAGPSLNKNCDVLKRMQDKALIFAGGSALNALVSKGITPHFGGTVDPNITQYERMIAHADHKFPIFTKGRTYFEAYRALKGPKVYLSGNNMYPLTDWVEKELGLSEQKATEGYNILHLMIDIARRCGCSPIIFVGIDLAFTDMASYAGGVIDDASVTQEGITGKADINTNAFLRKDIHGEPVHTLWKWVAESQYTSNYARQFPDTPFVNATEGGLGFEGIANIRLQDMDLPLQQNLREKVSCSLEESRLSSVTHDGVLEVMKQIDESLERCYELAGGLAGALKALETGLMENNVNAIRRASRKVERFHEELQEEVACETILEPVNQVRSILYERRFNQIEYDPKLRSDQERMVARCRANQEEALSLKECAELNQMIIRQAVRDFGCDGYDVSLFGSELIGTT